MTALRREMRESPAAWAGQRGGFVLGAIIGLLVGLALALGVAMYVTKVPVPFVDRVQTRTPEQDAAEAERNRNWDPNGPLANRSPVRPPVADVPAAVPPGIANPAPAVLPPAAAASKPARPPRDPAAILAGAAPGSSAPASTKPAAETLIYFVQTGAFTRSEEADQQRATLTLEGFSAKITEREQNGRMLYRVRLGPFYKQEEADSVLERVREYAPPATMVRVARPAS